MPGLTPITNLSTYAKAIGKAYVYVAVDGTIAANWSLLGITEGDIVVNQKNDYNDYKLPEWTGNAVHQRDVVGEELSLTIPLIWGDPLLYQKISPTSSTGGGFSKPQAAVTVSALIIPITEVGSGLTNGAGGTTWAPAAPVHAIWIHRATFEPGQYHFHHADGGKVIRQVGLMAMFDATKPEGQMLYTIGAPDLHGISTYRV